MSWGQPATCCQTRGWPVHESVLQHVQATPAWFRPAPGGHLAASSRLGSESALKLPSWVFGFVLLFTVPHSLPCWYKRHSCELGAVVETQCSGCPPSAAGGRRPVAGSRTGRAPAAREGPCPRGAQGGRGTDRCVL